MHGSSSFQIFLGSSILFSIVAETVYIPTHRIAGSLLSTSSPLLAVCRLSDVGHSDPCEVALHCGFDSQFCNRWQC